MAANFALSRTRRVSRTRSASAHPRRTTTSARRKARPASRTSQHDRAKPTTFAYALKLLADWPKPPRRDPITGLTLDLPPRDAKIVVDALTKAGVGIFAGSDVVRKEAAQNRREAEARREFGTGSHARW